MASFLAGTSQPKQAAKTPLRITQAPPKPPLQSQLQSIKSPTTVSRVQHLVSPNQATKEKSSLFGTMLSKVFSGLGVGSTPEQSTTAEFKEKVPQPSSFTYQPMPTQTASIQEKRLLSPFVSDESQGCAGHKLAKQQSTTAINHRQGSVSNLSRLLNSSRAGDSASKAKVDLNSILNDPVH